MSRITRDNTDDLETLARAYFDDLTEAEVRLLRSAAKGESAWCGPSRDDIDPANDPSRAEPCEGYPGWGLEREIRAELIRWLCVDQQATEKVDPRGVNAHAAKIVGRLDLSFANVTFPLGLSHCRLVNGARFVHTCIPALNLYGSWTRSLSADGIRITGDVLLCRGFIAEGEVGLTGAQIGGNIACSGGRFKNAGGKALNADGAHVGGYVFLDKGFTAEGEVWLLEVQIGGSLECDGGRFANPSGDALSADSAHVGGSLFLRQRFTAEGEVRLPGAHIGGDLSCIGGTFKNPGGTALNAEGARVARAILLREVTAEGEVRLLGAQVGVNLECDGSTFKNPTMKHGPASGIALYADGINVSGGVFLRRGFAAEGEVRLSGAQIGTDVSCSGGSFTELNAEGATIKGNFSWLGIRKPQVSELDLINLSAGAIMDDEASWPEQGCLRLDGFTYRRFSTGPRDAKGRLKWLSKQRPFAPQPYRQLANVLHETGDEHGAHEVLFEMERLRREEEDHRWHEHLSSWLLRCTIGYGHKTRRVLWWLLGLTLTGFVLSGLGYVGGAMAPSQKGAFETFNDSGAPPAYYPQFNAAIYSLEHSFPFVDLGERDHWAPVPGVSHRAPVLAWSFLRRLRDFQVFAVHPFQLNAPEFLRLWLWSQIATGWVLATLFVAGLTGIVKSR